MSVATYHNSIIGVVLPIYAQIMKVSVLKVYNTICRFDILLFLFTRIANYC